MTWVPAAGQRVRFLSKLNDNIVLSMNPNLGMPAFQVRNLETDWPMHPELTDFEVQMNGDGSFQLWLSHVPGLAPVKLTWYWPPSEDDVCVMAVNPSFIDSGNNDACWIDSLGDPWFALNNWDRNRVVDIYEYDTSSGAQIDAFSWNGGDNQWWRGQVV